MVEVHHCYLEGTGVIHVITDKGQGENWRDSIAWCEIGAKRYRVTSTAGIGEAVRLLVDRLKESGHGP